MLLFKNVRIPESTEKNMIRLAIPDGPEIEGHNPPLRWNAVIDVFSFRYLRHWGELLQWTDADEHVVNNSWSFPIVVNTGKAAISGISVSKPSRDISFAARDSIGFD